MGYLPEYFVRVERQDQSGIGHDSEMSSPLRRDEGVKKNRIL
jgi:hypothetical protein